MASLDTTPALPPPPGQVSDFVDPPSIGYEAVVSGIITGAFALVLVTLRFITKIKFVKAVTLDDWFSLAALVFALARVVGGCISVYFYGLGRHSWDEPIGPALKTTSVEVAVDAIYLFAIMFAKLSIIALYIRVFGVHQIFRRLCQALAVFVCLYSIICTPLYILGCVPSGARTEAQIDADQCIKTIQLNISVGALNIFSDTVLLILPIPQLAQLQLTKARKVALLIVFSTGALALACSIVREALFVQNVHVVDGLYTQVADIMWLTIEMNVGIVAGCLPVLTPLFRHTGAYDTVSSYWSRLKNASAVVLQGKSSASRLRKSTDANSSPESLSEKRSGESLTGATTTDRFLSRMEQGQGTYREHFEN